MIENLKNFPQTRYQGSKRKLLNWIFEHSKDLDFETVLDGFGGSSAVSYLFKTMYKTVHYNDKLTFNHIIGKALIENKNIQLDEIILNDILTTNNSTRSFVTQNFEDIYFLPEENAAIDLISSNIIDFNIQTEADCFKRAIAYYSLFQTCLIKRPYNLFHRKNLNVRTADVKRNFGNKTTWEQPINDLMLRFSCEANNSIFDNGKDCKSLNKSIFDIDEYGYDLVYLDPPYIRTDGSNESSDYYRCYHFLEGLSRYDDWGEFVDFGSINLRPKDLYESNDFNKANIKEKIDNLFEKFRNSTIMLSYKIGGIPSVDEIENLLKKYKRRVFTVSLHYKYALNKQNGNAALNREVLIIGI
jgi:adenine-specific DNA-methyltransferase